MSFFKNVYNYIHSLSRGEEVLSDRRKFTYIFSSFAFIHLFSVVIFSILKNPLFVTFNVLAIFLYLGLISLAKKKHYLMVSMIAEIEVLVSVSLISFTYGTIIGYSFYLFAMIPTIFYITSTVKEMKHPTVYCLVFSFITLLCFFTILVSEPFFSISETLTNRPILTLVVRLFNAGMTFFFCIAFSLLFVWEMKSNTSQLQRRNQQLVEVSRKDPLTKLANRRSMMENADSISSQLRDTDFVCRWGGEEILIVIDGRLQTATAIAERMRSNIENTTVMHEGQRVNVTMTFGVAQAETTYRIEDLIQLADTRLYYGKEHGRNQVVNQDMKD